MSEITGEYRFRNEGDLLVLQVCENNYDVYVTQAKRKWRDAKTEDLLNVVFSVDRFPSTVGGLVGANIMHD